MSAIPSRLIPCPAIIEDLSALENRASFAARRATGVAEYSPYAQLREAMRDAIHAMHEIAALPEEVRERMEGGAK